MKRNLIILILTACMTVIYSGYALGQSSKKAMTKSSTTTTIQLIQFHSEHRCMTCNLIEKLSKETLQQNFPAIPFKLVNVDDSKNEKMAEEFEATGTALFLYNPTTKKKKDLTDFAFMNAKNKPVDFRKGLKKEIEQFKL
jgi:hypothetical protein